MLNVEVIIWLREANSRINTKTITLQHWPTLNMILESMKRARASWCSWCSWCSWYSWCSSECALKKQTQSGLKTLLYSTLLPPPSTPKSLGTKTNKRSDQAASVDSFLGLLFRRVSFAYLPGNGLSKTEDIKRYACLVSLAFCRNQWLLLSCREDC